MLNEPMVFVDVETNGKFGADGRIIEIGVIRAENGEVIDTFHSLVNPGSTVPVWIERLTGISNADLVHAPYFEDVARQLHRIFSNALFVAHNVRFDYSFFKSHFASIGIEYKPKLFCTVRMSRALYPEHSGHSLEKIIKRHSIPTNSRHRAYDDAKAMYDFYKLTVAHKGAQAVEENIRRQIRTKSLPPHVDESTIDKLPSSPGVYIFKDEDGHPLYVGKSIDIKARVRSHFTNDTRIVKEMKLSQRSYSIDSITTDTEIEALLLESATIKKLQPLFNRRLRRTTKQSVLVRTKNEHGYLEISVENKALSDMTDTSMIYGVYTSRAKAKSALESAMKTFQLCPKLLALESSGGACFRSQLGLCKGACIQKEPSNAYNQRVELALSRSKIDSWPFAKKIAVKISDTKSLIVDQWIIEGILLHDFEPTLERLSNGFDIDTYKILRSYIRTHPASVSQYGLGIELSS